MTYHHVPTVFDHDPTPQEIFDACVRHLAAQKRPAVNKTGICLYRAPNGCACAVGHFIQDDAYNHNMEGASIDGLTGEHADYRIPAWFHYHKGILYALQEAHDGACGPSDLRSRLCIVASRFDLSDELVGTITEFNT